MYKALLLSILLLICISAREIVFPPIVGVESFQERVRNDDGIDISTGSDFCGLLTFANLPYVNCFTDAALESDIFLLGAPFDTVSLPNEPCSRQYL